jgi:hypothetical protein
MKRDNPLIITVDMQFALHQVIPITEIAAFKHAADNIINCTHLASEVVDFWLGEWSFENELIINPAKREAVCFANAEVTEPLTIH